MQMDQFNAKLYQKYNDLKKRKAFVEDEWNQRSVTNMRNCLEETEVLIEEWRKENDQLRAKVASIQEQYEESEKLRLEECQKTKQLSHEVERLQYLLRLNTDNGERAVLGSPCASPRLESRSKRKGSIRKSTPNLSTGQTEVQYKEAASGQKESAVVCEGIPENDKLIGRDSSVFSPQPDCCKGNMNSGETTNKSQGTCFFKTLLEFLVGMKFCIESQTEEPCFKVTHENSGYTFTLTWLRPEDGDDSKLIYEVSSLGTLERVALECMKEGIEFSMSMLPLFFKKISQVARRCV